MTDTRVEMTLTDQIADTLARQIRESVYPVSSRLPTEKSMSEQFQVSRTVIREAISRLKSEGLVETIQGSGTVVLDPKLSEAFRLGRPGQDPLAAVLQILELRRGIEVEMAALAAANRTDEDLGHIERALSAIDSAVESGTKGIAEDFSFHMAISHATKNPHYPSLLHMLTRAVKDAIFVTRSHDEKRHDFKNRVRYEHIDLWLAIKERDVTAARAAAFLHMRNTASRVMQADESYWKKASSNTAMQRLISADLREVISDK